jgi:hypothetical protein
MSVASEGQQLAMDRAWTRLLAILLRMIGLDEMWDTLSDEDRRAQVAELRHDFANTITPAMPNNWRARGVSNGIIDKVFGTEHPFDAHSQETTPDDNS